MQVARSTRRASLTRVSTPLGRPCAVSFPLTKSLRCESHPPTDVSFASRRDTRPEPIHCDIYRVLRIPEPHPLTH
jgi:hypothetical protein